MSTPTISVVLVSHREQPFLRPAIESVFAQTFADWELVLVDNGANFPAEILGDKVNDDRVRWVRLEKNCGIPHGQNAGVAAARGEFIALLDHDDVMLPARLERQLEKLKADPELGLVSSLVRRIDETDTVIGGEFSLVTHAEQRAYSAFAAPVVTPAYSGRRALFQRFPFREAFPWASDLDFLARAAEVARLEAVPEVLLHYRWHREQTTQLRRAAIERDLVSIRLLTARRRSERDENFEAIAAMWPSQAPAADECCRQGAEQALKENFPLLAAYHARRMIVLQRSPRNAVRAMRLAALAWRQSAAAQRSEVATMFWRGAVKALKLHPVWSEARHAPAFA